MHELGHLLGLHDVDIDADPHDLMAEELAAGLRRVVTPEDVDDVFASGDWE